MIGANNVGLNGGGETDAGVVAGWPRSWTPSARAPADQDPADGDPAMGEFADNPARQRIRRINAALAALDDGGRTVRILDIGSHFLDGAATSPSRSSRRRPSHRQRLPDLGQRHAADAGRALNG